ncbi:MAG TPA: ribose-5-phosphate isomerase RpiA [Thermoanaerobaculia bacterium]|jgi:ribose 5-phosphate isomerase A|nr:ribose-5-phosphate isomerase RpiA [Thermoanaerobaculia bacterium]
MSAQEFKIAAARAALEEVRAEMTLGLGSGTTSEEFVRLLGASPHAQSVRCTCTSLRTERLARSLNIEILRLADVIPIDLAIDGADEIDHDLRLIKGHGGALLREKIVEQQARRFIVIADGTKVVERLGAGNLPIEVTPFAQEVLMASFDYLKLLPVLRRVEGAPFITDEGNRIIDVRIPSETDIADIVAEVRSHAGVIETGFFPTEATEAIIADANGVWRMRRD